MRPPSDASVWRRQVGARVARRYAAHPDVVATLIAGSTARGHADRYSDVEVLVFWDRAPSEETRRALGGDELRETRAFDADDQVWLDLVDAGVAIEVAHHLAAYAGRAVDTLVVEHRPDAREQALAAAVTTGLPLSGAPLIDRWRAALAAYPEELAAAVIARHGNLDLSAIDVLVARDNNLLMVQAVLVRTAEQLLRLLFAVNRVYDGGFKWIEPAVARLAAAPPDLLARLRHVFSSPPGAAAAALAALAEDTIDLVERHVAGFDVARLRRGLNRTPLAWDAPPSC